MINIFQTKRNKEYQQLKNVSDLTLKVFYETKHTISRPALAYILYLVYSIYCKNYNKEIFNKNYFKLFNNNLQINELYSKYEVVGGESYFKRDIVVDELEVNYMQDRRLVEVIEEVKDEVILMTYLDLVIYVSRLLKEDDGIERETK